MFTKHVDQGYMGPFPKRMSNKFMIIDNKAHEIHNVVVHRFTVAEADDPDIHAAAPLHEWQISEIGQWVFAHAIETPMWHRITEPLSWNTSYAVTAKLKGADNSFWQLKWGSSIDKR